MTVVPVPPPAGELSAAQDVYRLRREGIGHIQEAGSDHWTDYNTDDYGIIGDLYQVVPAITAALEAAR